MFETCRRSVSASDCSPASGTPERWRPGPLRVFACTMTTVRAAGGPGHSRDVPMPAVWREPKFRTAESATRPGSPGTDDPGRRVDGRRLARPGWSRHDPSGLGWLRRVGCLDAECLRGVEQAVVVGHELAEVATELLGSRE